MKYSSDYESLKRVVSTYIQRHPIPTSKNNRVKIAHLQLLREQLPETQKEYKKVRDDIVLSNGGFGMKYVLKYHSLLNEETSISELFQEAMIGIAEAVDAFDIGHNTAFTTYAYYHVKKRLIDYIKKNKLVKAPRDIARNMKHVNEISEFLVAHLSREPSVDEIKKELKKQRRIDLTVDMIESIILLLELNSSSKEDTFIVEYKDQVYCETRNPLLDRMKMNIERDLELFNKEEAEIIKLRFGLKDECPHVISEIKYLLNLPEDRVRFI